jgi:hypothetical protein
MTLEMSYRMWPESGVDETKRVKRYNPMMRPWRQYGQEERYIVPPRIIGQDPISNQNGKDEKSMYIYH